MSRSNLGKLNLQLKRLEAKKEKSLRRLDKIKMAISNLLGAINFITKQIGQKEAELLLKHNAEVVVKEGV